MGWTINYKWENKKDVIEDILGYDRENILHYRGVREGLILIWKGEDEQNHGILYLISKEDNVWGYKDIDIWECKTLNNKELKLLGNNDEYKEELKRYKEELEKEKNKKENIKKIIENLIINKNYKVFTKNGSMNLQFIFKIGKKVYFDKGYLLLKNIVKIEEI